MEERGEVGGGGINSDKEGVEILGSLIAVQQWGDLDGKQLANTAVAQIGQRRGRGGWGTPSSG